MQSKPHLYLQHQPYPYPLPLPLTRFTEEHYVRLWSARLADAGVGQAYFTQTIAPTLTLALNPNPNPNPHPNPNASTLTLTLQP